MSFRELQHGSSSETQPLVSIIIPVYNVCDYLAEALDSVLAQSYRNLEILVINDGSTDGSGKICDDYARRDGRIRVIHQKNRGVSTARNAGLNATTGDLVAFLDSDDRYHDTFIESLVSVLLTENTDMAICRYTVHQTKGTMAYMGTETAYPAMEPGIYDRIGMLRAFADRRASVYIWHSLYRRELWKDIRFPDGRLFEDFDVLYRIYDSCRTVSVVDQPLYMYRLHPESTNTASHSPRRIYDSIHVYSQFDSFIESNIPEVFSVEQLKKCRNSEIHTLMREYMNCIRQSTNHPDKALRKQIVGMCRKYGTGGCGRKTRAIYCMIRFCPRLLPLAYGIYRSARGRLRAA